MNKSIDRKSFWATLPGILMGIAAIISAIAGFYIALPHIHDSSDKTPPSTPPITITPTVAMTTSTETPTSIITPTPTSTPSLSVTPDPLFINFGTMSAGESSSRTFPISNIGGGTLIWNISNDRQWITVNPVSGANSGTVTVNINTTGLGLGINTGTITINSNGGIKTGIVNLDVKSPTRVDFTSFMTPVRQQGSEASTVGFAVAAALEYQIYKKLGYQVTISPRYIYYYAKVEGNLDPHSDTGANVKDGIKVIQTRGAVSEDVWPYIAGDLASDPPAGIKTALKYKIIQSTQITTVEDIKSSLQKYGPVVTGISVYESWSNTQTGIIPDPTPNEKLIGGTAICIVGYDDDKKLIKFKNSWGVNWGDNGYGYLSYNYVNKYSNDIWSISDIVT